MSNPYADTTDATPQINRVAIPQDEADQVKDLEERIAGLVKSRQRNDARTYVNGAFMDGDHFTQFDRATGRLQTEKAPRGTVNRVVQKGYKKMVEMKNTILSDDPRWQAHPEPDGQDGSFSQQAMTDATNISDWLTDIATRKQVLKKRDDMIFNATWQPYTAIGAFYNEQTQEYDVLTWEFFDILVEPFVSTFEDSGILVIQSMRERSKITANPQYSNTDGMKEEKRWAANDWQNDRLREKYGSAITLQHPVKMFEVFEKCIVTDDLKKAVKKLDKKNNWIDDIDNGQTVLYFCTLAGGRLIREVYLPYHRYPIVAYHIPDGPLLGPAPLERIIALNKSYDVQMSRKEQYVNQVAAGRVLKHKNTKILRMTNAHGDMLEWDGDPSMPPTIPQIPDLPAVVQMVAADTERLMAELSVTGSDVMGMIHGSGGRGAQIIEAMKGLDISSMATARKNLAYTLEQLAEILLMLADWHQHAVSTVTKQDESGTPKSFKVIGGRYAATTAFKTAFPDPTSRPTVLSSETKVTVSIESGMAYTQEGKWNILQNLASMGAISVQTLLSTLKVSGNVSQELRQMMMESGQTMLSSQDFQALDPDKQAQILQWLQQANISMPVTPRQSIGTVKKASTPNGRY